MVLCHFGWIQTVFCATVPALKRFLQQSGGGFSTPILGGKVGGQASGNGTGNLKDFIGNMYKYEVFDINQHIITKFQSQVSSYTHQKIAEG